MDSQPPVSPPAETQKKSFLDRFRRAPTQLENPDDRRLEVPAKQSLTRRLRNALSRTGEGIGAVFLGGKAIDDALLDELETLLLTADVGVEVTNNILAELVRRLRRRELKTASHCAQLCRKYCWLSCDPVSSPWISAALRHPL